MWGMLLKSRNIQGDGQSYREGRREVVKCAEEDVSVLRERRRGNKRPKKGLY